MWGIGDPDCPIDLDKLTASIKTHEGTGPVKNGRFIPYRDSTGHLTAGYGINLDEGLDATEAEWLLQHRLDLAIAQAQAQPWWHAVNGSDARARAFIEIGWNMGFGALAGFSKALAAAEVGDWSTCSAELLDSLWAHEVGKRAEILAAMVLTGEDQPAV